MIDLMLEMVAPHICYGCGFVGSPLCDSCRNDIEDTDFGRCIWCLRPSGDSHQCRRCGAKAGAAGAWAVGLREGVLLELVDGYKFDACRGASNELAKMMDEVVPVFGVPPIVCWVPTAPAHIRERGFDHAALLARAFARLRGYRTIPLLRRRHSLTQHTLGKSARERAAHDAFAARGDIDSSAPIILIDDIVTTGATLKACVHELRERGAESVYVAVVCRQPPTPQ